MQVLLSASGHPSTWGQARHLIPIGVAGSISWAVGLVRMLLSRFYRPVAVGFRTTTSVVVPSYREDPEILDRCLDSFLAENPTEVIVVPDASMPCMRPASRLGISVGRSWRSARWPTAGAW
jgi:hypothetical protein